MQSSESLTLEEGHHHHHYHPHSKHSSKPLRTRSPNFSAMKIFNRFRKIIMRLVFSMPTTSRRPTAFAGVGGGGGSTSSSDQYYYYNNNPETPKTSCSSSYYSSHLHYNEAIADCIEFFNKSSSSGAQEGCNWFSDGRKSNSDVLDNVF